LVQAIMMKFLTPLLLALGLCLPAAAPAQAQDYRIQPGDTLQLDVLEDGTLSRPMLVLPDGTVAVPSAGVVKAGGLTLTEAQAAVTAALAPNFAKPPTVYLSVGQLGAPRAPAGAGAGPGASVFVMGEVAKSGRAALVPGTTLLQFLAESGGLTPFAATKRIQLRRTGADGVEKVYLFDYDAVQRGATARNMTLKRGDVIIVPTKRLFE
jgi:polysaccharide export outer membrane protein